MIMMPVWPTFAIAFDMGSLY